MAEDHLRELCLPKDPIETSFTRGVLYAVRRLALMPHEITTHDTQRKSHDRTRSNTDADARSRRDAIFANTPFYAAYTADTGAVAGGTERPGVGGGQDG